MTKRYLIFGGEHYYPGGGIEDLLGFTDTTQEAVELIDIKSSDSGHCCEIDWVNCYDTVDCCIVVISNLPTSSRA